ncbi:hypothetical protein I7X12_19030 [Halosimplex litoreum]|uniref:Bacterial Ig-like domain-containing protein n=1 Tax=Halosimplex litoreum TaxID=1198301 RepID=A0A7T3FY89_9EURY|nr:hypothetical protein [Halosimplex litoreum]QPV62792.1 hypothetical protein I7X12_19030 [Halosimplex litoreum]
MNRRHLLGVAASGIGAAGLYWAGFGRQSDDGPRALSEAHGGNRVADSHGRLELASATEDVEFGEPARFEIGNTGPSTVGVGCQVPWTIQRRESGGWSDVLWTDSNAFAQRATELSPGGTTSETVTMSRAALDDHGIVELSLNPGRYRFVLLGVDPFLATDFRLV